MQAEKKTVLVTGGAGFIGSHTCLALLRRGYSVIAFDNLSNSSLDTLNNVAYLAGLQQDCEGSWHHSHASTRLYFFHGDVRSGAELDRAFALPEQNVAGVIHFAGLKSINHSQKDPLNYWSVNTSGTIELLQAMRRSRCKLLIFSSTAAVYGDTTDVPIPETTAVKPLNPYARSKAAVEQLLADLSSSELDWKLLSLRYFNPIGAHPSGRLGENPRSSPTNLFPVLCEVALGVRQCLEIYGDDWPTEDGTGIRDFLHVQDLAEGHCLALNHLLDGRECPPQLNLGTGSGCSVFELVRCFERVTGTRIAYTISPRRDGDVATSVADPSLAESALGWKTCRGLEDMCRDGWKWALNNQEEIRSRGRESGDVTAN
ncbi:MAG: UDP-glucose 4-epimerase GalE [Synechococcaceae cyanobacterium]